MTRSEWQGLRWGLFFISPYIIGFLLFTMYPIFASLYYSFTSFNIVNLQPEMIGLENYYELFVLDDKFWPSLTRTGVYLAERVILTTVFNILIAYLLSLKVRGVYLYRTIFVLPILAPGVATALTWNWLLNPKFGLVNGFLRIFGIEGPRWLASPDTAMLSLVFIAVWSSGTAILIYLAGIQDIPTHLYEAADLDGANVFHKMWHVTLPLLTPVMLFNIIITIIFGMQEFVTPFLVTQGGPNNATLLYGLYLYKRAFQYNTLGMASAMAWILFVAVAILTLLILRLSKSTIQYER